MSITALREPLVQSARATRDPARIARLVRLAAGGDEPAWTALVQEFSGLLWAIARAHRLSDADAADVVQTTWVRALDHLGRLTEPTRLGAWLATTATRECLRVLRHGGRQIPTAQPPEPDPDARGLDAQLLLDERDGILAQALSLLPERDQALLRLLVADPTPSYDEIGAALHMPIGSIGPTRARCLERLRRAAARVGLAHESVVW